MVAGDSEEQQALALLQKEMLAFILEGVTERIERGEAPVLAAGVAAAISKQVEAAIESGLRRFDLPTATRIAEEAAKLASTAPASPPAQRSVFDAGLSGEEAENPPPNAGWRRVSPVWLIVPLLLLLGIAGWFAWQKSSALDAVSAEKTRIAVERDSLGGEICRSARAQQEQLARLRNTDIYKASCSATPPQPGGAPEFCQAVDALDTASRPDSNCSGN